MTLLQQWSVIPSWLDVELTVLRYFQDGDLSSISLREWRSFWDTLTMSEKVELYTQIGANG